MPPTPSVPRVGRYVALRVLLLALTLAGFLALPVAADAPRLVRDIERTGEPYVIPCDLSACPPPNLVYGSLLADFTPLGDLLVFAADDRLHGLEPWVTDGTAAGTRMLADATPGPDWSDPTFFGTIGDRAFFWVWSGDAEGLWATDGTPAGTELLGPACDGCSGFDPTATAVASYDGHLFFQLYVSGAKRLYLLRTDGFETELVRDLCNSPDDFCLDRVRRSIVWDGSLYFDSRFANETPSVFRMDGAGSSPVKVAPTCSWDQDLLPREGELWFVGTCLEDGWYTAGLYRTDSPVAQPTLVRSFGKWSLPGGQPPQHLPTRLTAITDDSAAFVVGKRIWLTDGTEAGTKAGPELDAVATLARLGDLALVAGADGAGDGLWSLDDAGNLAELAGVATEGALYVARGRAWFAADDGQHGFEPWVTDGTASGTVPLGDLAPGVESSNPGFGGLEVTGFVAAGDDVYFAADDGVHDIELWAVETGDPPPPPSCVPDQHALCLQGGRFRVEVSWTNFEGKQGVGRAIPQTSDTGSFWFFDARNHELVVKVLDGRVYNDAFWVYYGSLTNVEFTLVVTDTETGRTWSRTNPSRKFASGGDVDAFPDSP